MKPKALILFSFLFLIPILDAQARQKAVEKNGGNEFKQPQVLGVLMYADWCQSCKVLEPKLNEVKTDFDGKGILFFRFDMTNDFTKNQSALFASWTGLKGIFDEHVGKTGYMLLLDAKSRNVLARLTKTQTPEEIRSAIQNTLSR